MTTEPADRDVTITDVQTARLDSEFEWTLVRVYTDAGVAGTGEAVLAPGAAAYVEHFRDRLVGQNPLQIDAILTRLFDGHAHVGAMSGVGVAAVSAIDIALHDLAGKLLGVPAHQLLGGSHRDAVRVYCDCHAGDHLYDAEGDDDYTPAAYADAAEEVIAEGFDAVKFDLDGPTPHDGDRRNRHLNANAIDHKAEIVEAVTERVGDRADVAFDCHWSWTSDSVRRLSRAIADYDVWWLEDPVPPENHDLQIDVATDVDVTVAAGENAYRIEGARRLIENGGVDVFHPDVPKTGGMYETKKVADLAKAYAVPVALHNVASPLGTMASAHVAASVSNFLALEYHARDDPEWGSLIEESPLEDGHIVLPDAPGLGVQLDEAAVAERLVDGEEPLDPA
ncbi:mandelate racemase/muconate lactonizing enzyme family protein [Halorubrum gandharaense]